MDAELFLGEEEEEVEVSPPPYQVNRLLQEPSTKPTRSEYTQMGCRPLVVPSLPRVLGAYATYMGLLYSIPVFVNLDYRAWVEGVWPSVRPQQCVSVQLPLRCFLSRVAFIKVGGMGTTLCKCKGFEISQLYKTNKELRCGDFLSSLFDGSFVPGPVCC